MNRSAVLLFLLLSQATWAHHTTDHMMLSEDVEQVIAATRAGGDAGWLVWAGVAAILLVGFVRWWHTMR
jgi:hypothetical protein